MCVLDYTSILIALMVFSFCRPIAGSINFCPLSLSGSDIDDDFLLAVAKHEILHALVSECLLCLLSLQYMYQVGF